MNQQFADDQPASRRELDQRFTALSKHFDLRMDAQDKALLLARDEEKKHFEDLNHETERVKLIQDTYLPRETFDTFVREFRGWKDEYTLQRQQDKEQFRIDFGGQIRPLQDAGFMAKGKDQWFLGVVLTVAILLVNLGIRLAFGT